MPKEIEKKFMVTSYEVSLLSDIHLIPLHNQDRYIGYCSLIDGKILNSQDLYDKFGEHIIWFQEVSIYEAIPELVPHGMKYDKGLDTLIPYAIKQDDEIYLKKLNFDYSELINKSNIDKHKEELARISNEKNGLIAPNAEFIKPQWKRVHNRGNHIAADGTPFDTVEEALAHNDTLVSTLNAEFIKPKINEHITQRENGFIKADKNKIDFSLVDARAYEDLGKVLTFGAKKYAPNNWKKGDIDSYISALERHLIEVKKALQSGNKSLFVDSDSNLQHGAALLFNAMALHYFIEKELNDN